MIEESLLKSNFIGKDGFIWWIGQVADPKVWRNENSRIDGKDRNPGEPIDEEAWGYRCKVRIIGYHSFDRNQLSDEDLPWAHVLTSASDGAPGQGGFGKLPLLVGGETVLGFFLDGEEAQQPVLMSCFHRTPAVVNVPNPNPFDAFSGSTGVLSKSATRTKQQPKGNIKETPKNVTTPESQVSFSSNEQLLNTAFNTDTDLGIGSVGGADYSSVFNPDTKLNLGSAFGKPNIPTDVLYFDDNAELAFLKNFEPPVPGSNGCSDNLISQLSAQIENFISFVNGLEQTALGFIDPIRNKIVDIQQEIRNVARIIASIMKLAINGIRDSIFKLIGTLFKEFGITIPSPLQLPISEAAKNILNIIFCIFEKLFGPILDFIMGLLEGLLGKSANVPRCASEETIGALISKIASMLDGVLSDVLSGLDWLAGGIGQIASAITGGLDFINQLLSFLSCDALACKSTITWDPFNGITLPSSDNWTQVIDNIDILGGLGNNIDDTIGLLSLFGSSNTPFKDCREKITNPKTQDDISRVPLGTQFYKCIPPEIIIYGDGTGAEGLAIVSNSKGSILTVKVTNPGRGYSYPPEVKIVDKSGYGKGAYAKSTINSRGNIESIYIVDPGQGYCLTNLVGITTDNVIIPERVESPDASIESTTIPTVIGISTVAVGIATNIVIERPGRGYSPGDTIEIGNCVYEPILTDNGSIIAVTSPSSCKSQFKTIPTVTINTTTGEGAVIYPVIEYIPQFIVDNSNVLSGLTTDQILKVVQCISIKTT
jgi:hypothetical protein